MGEKHDFDIINMVLVNNIQCTAFCYLTAFKTGFGHTELAQHLKFVLFELFIYTYCAIVLKHKLIYHGRNYLDSTIISYYS